MNDFNTYEYVPPVRGQNPYHIQKEKHFTFAAMGSVDVDNVHNNVDNMVNFTNNMPNKTLSRWEGSLNIDKNKLTSKVTKGEVTEISDELERKIIREIR